MTFFNFYDDTKKCCCCGETYNEKHGHGNLCKKCFDESITAWDVVIWLLESDKVFGNEEFKAYVEEIGSKKLEKMTFGEFAKIVKKDCDQQHLAYWWEDENI